MKSVLTITAITLLITFGLMMHAEPVVLIDFEDVPGATEIGDHYLSLGVRFFKGNAEKGASTGIEGSAWVFPGNVLVPEAGSNNDIIVQFFGPGENRTFANYVSVYNDYQGLPPEIILAAFDQSDNQIQSVNIYGPSGFGELSVDGIW